MNFIDISYYYHANVKDPDTLLESHLPSLGYLHFFPEGTTCSGIKFINNRAERTVDRTRFYFFKGNNSRTWWPLKPHKFLRQLHPDVVLTHGLIFPMQVIFLRKQLGDQVKIFVQHHGDQPGKGIMKTFQSVADRYIDAYLFTEKKLAVEWIHKGVIKDSSKVHEVIAGSTYFRMSNKNAARKHTGIPQGKIFLWVGRLDENKDPITVIKAFLQYVMMHADSYLYMIYQHDKMSDQIEELLNNYPQQKHHIRLVGIQPHKELEHWYNSADYFVSGSHYESYGYALCEAMACGCFPIVTDIPSFRQITYQGRYGILYEPGNANDLLESLLSLKGIVPESRQTIADYFEKELSFKAMANKIYQLGNKLNSK